MVRYLIIGSGVAGIRAAELLRRHDPDCAITMVSDDPHPFYLRPALPDYIAGELTPKDLRASVINIYEINRIQIHLGKRVSRILPDQSKVELDGEEIEYDKLLIAAGTSPRRPEVAGSDLPSVVTLHTLDDAERVIACAGHSHSAVVAGTGLVGIELVRALRRRGLRVTYLVPDEHPWPQMAYEASAQEVEEALRRNGVDLRPAELLTAIIGGKGDVAAAVGSKSGAIACDMVGFAMENVPNTGLVAGSGVAVDHGILVSERMETSVPNVFAAGDVAQVYSPEYGTHRLNFGWASARQQGELAALAMSGQELPKRKAGSPNEYVVTQLHGVPLVARWQ